MARLTRRAPYAVVRFGRGRAEIHAISAGWVAAGALALAIGIAGCSGDDPPSRITSHPGEGTSNGGATTSSGGTAGGDAGGTGQAGQDADAGPSYRDPAAGDGACAAPNLTCGTACIAVGHDVDHCGTCDTKCVGASAQCIGGKCACGPGFDYCAAGCMDIATDTNNCGACGNVCDPNQFDSCVGGQCTTTQ